MATSKNGVFRHLPDAKADTLRAINAMIVGISFVCFSPPPGCGTKACVRARPNGAVSEKIVCTGLKNANFGVVELTPNCVLQQVAYHL